MLICAFSGAGDGGDGGPNATLARDFGLTVSNYVKVIGILDKSHPGSKKISKKGKAYKCKRKNTPTYFLIITFLT